jgi:hypothetical protein
MNMGRFYDALSDEHIAFIGQQAVFFVATGTSAGRINLSPKGLDTFRVLSPTRVGYADLTGSGNETSAHLEHDGRITVMFCGFSDKALILRLYGSGRVVGLGDADWPQHSPSFPQPPGLRQIILIDVQSVQTSCGFGVPMMALVQPRDALTKWAQQHGAQKLAAYQHKHNSRSIDGLRPHPLETNGGDE